MFERLQVVGCDAFVADVTWIGNIVKVDLGIKVEFLSPLGLWNDEGRARGREEAESPPTSSSVRGHQDHGGRLVRDRPRIVHRRTSHTPDLGLLLVKHRSREPSIYHPNFLEVAWSSELSRIRLKFQSDLVCSCALFPFSTTHNGRRYEPKHVFLATPTYHTHVVVVFSYHAPLAVILTPESLRCGIDRKSGQVSLFTSLLCRWARCSLFHTPNSSTYIITYAQK